MFGIVLNELSIQINTALDILTSFFVDPLQSAGSVVVTTSACHWGLCIPRESGNHVNVGPVSIWYEKEPLRTTSTLAVTIISDYCVSQRSGCLE